MTGKLLLITIALWLTVGCTGGKFDARPVVGQSGQGGVEEFATSTELGKSAFVAGRFDQAVGHFRKALNIDPRSVQALNGLAASYDRLGRFEAATRLYKSALKRAPRSVATLNNLGYSYYLQRKLGLAAIHLNEAANFSRGDNPVIKANLRRVDVALRKHTASRNHMAGKQDVSAIGALSSLNSRLTHNKIPRLVRSGWATYDLHTRQARDIRPPGQDDDHGASPPSADKHPARLKRPPTKGTQKTGKRGSPAMAPFPSVIVSNGTGRALMAMRMANYLKNNGLPVTALTNAQKFSKRNSTIFYRSGQEDAAIAYSFLLRSIPRLVEREGQNVMLYIELGADLLDFDRHLIHQFLQQTEEANHVEL